MVSTHKKSYLVVAFTAFLASSYLDNVRGPLLPYLKASTSVDELAASAWLSLGNVGTLIGIVAFATYLYRYSIRSLALASWCFCAGVCAVALVVGKGGILPLALALGLVIAAVQSVSNLLVLHGSDAKNKARNFCGLHLMFGIGSFFAPLAAAQVASGKLAWQHSLALPGTIFVAVALLTALILPRQTGAAAVKKPQKVKFDREKIAVLAIFLCYTSAQVLQAQWMTTYLPATGAITAVKAASYLSAYFVVVTLSRLGAYLILNEQREDVVMHGAIGLPTLCMVIGHYWPVAMVAAGVQAPFYPIFLAKMSKRFASIAERMTLFILVSAQIGLILSHSLMGELSDKLGILRAYWLPPVAMGLAGVGSLLLARKYKLLASPLKGSAYA